MSAQARESSAETTPVANPASGTTLKVPAGGHVEATFDFVNDAPFVAAFHLEAAGLPGSEWASGVGPEAKVMAAAAGGGTLRLALSPPPDAEIADYPFTVRIFSDGSEVSEKPLSLVLRVEPGSAPHAKPEPAVVERTAPAEDAVPGGNGASAAAVAPTPVPTPTPEPEPEAVPPPETTRPRATAQPVTARPVAPPPKPTPPPPTREEDLELVDLPEAAEVREAPVAEPSLLDPRDGAVLSLRPGETLLLRFRFKNDTRRERIFAIEEDRSLESTWINIIQDQIHLMPNAEGELSVRLSPPPNSEPGTYPFQVRVGPTGGVLTPYNLTLSVTATPAVRLKTDAPSVRSGPFARAVDFNLAVERAGNADTAFRIAVKAPRTAEDANPGNAEEPRGPDEIYETPRWRYLFDREMASLESLTHGRLPKPEPIRLRLQSKGIWWFGFRDTHRVRVAAVPVTDPTNGGKPGNALDLTAIRWRLTPVPGFILAPLALLALMLLGGTASDLRVVKPTYEAPDGTNYVVAVPQNNVVGSRLSWNAPWYALLRLTGGEERRGLVRPPKDIRATFTGTGQRALPYYYRVVSPLGSSQGVKVQFVRARKDTPLEVSGAQRMEDGSYRLTVPTGGIGRLTIKNRAQQDNRINFWVAKRPGQAFRVLDLLDEFSLDPIAQGGKPRDIKVKPGTGQDGGANELVFVTTDFAHPVLTVKLIAPTKN